MASESRLRVFRGMSASGYAQAVNLAIQLGMVPVLLAAWGPRAYADWVLLATLPSFLSMSDAGIAAVAGNRMALDWAAKRSETYRALAAATLRYLSILLGSILVLSLVMIWLLPWQPLLNLNGLSSGDAGRIIAVLAAIAILTLWSGIFTSLLRAEDRYATSVFWGSSMRLLEGLACCTAALAGSDLLGTALAMLTTRSAATIALILFCRQRLGWLPNPRQGTWLLVRPLLPAAVAQLSFPYSFAMYLNGVLIVISHLAGAEATAAFNTMRVLSRILAQFSAAIGHGLSSAFSVAVGSGRPVEALALLAKAQRASLLLVIMLAIPAVIWGDRIFTLWTHGRLPFDLSTWLALLCAAVLYAVWNLGISLPVVINRQVGLAAVFACSATLAPAMAYGLGCAAGTSAASMVPAMVDLIMVLAVSRWLVNYRREATALPVASHAPNSRVG